MHWIDWIFVVVPILGVLLFAIYTKRYVKSVADFLAGGRCAGRYLLANARGESDSGLTNTMSKFEIILVSGFVLNFWEKVSVPVLLLVGISGFVVYRFRETRALTLAQFLEMRYSRSFRLYMGGLAFLSGVLNYGIFPAVSSKFFIYFLNLPETVTFAGWAVPTFTLIMAGYLLFTVANILLGGQVTMMVTDCIEGIFSHAAYIIIVIAVFMAVGWKDIVETMSSAPPNYSLINPFDASKVEDFNLWYVVMALLLSVYGTMALQNRQGFNAAAKSPHESRMAGILGQWRGYARILMLLALGICTATFIRHPDFAAKSEPARAQIATIDAANAPQLSPHPVGSQEWFHDPATPQLQRQMTAPVALSHMLPLGIKGLFLAIMIMGLLAGDAGHLHSWGSIFVQDVIMPLRKKALSPTAHIWALRLSVTGVAIFAFTFSILMPQTQYIVLWMAITGGVFVGGAGAAIIGGLYWNRGTVQAAWAAAIMGSGLSLLGILLNSKLWPGISSWMEGMFSIELPAKFWFNGQQTAFIATLAAVGTYVAVSLITCKKPYDIDAMLHRNQSKAKPPAITAVLDRFRLKNILKFDDNFTFTDKLVAGGIFWWAMLLLALNVVVSIWNLHFGHWPVSWWSTYWLITGIILPFIIALVTLAWFGVGGLRDTRHFFHALATLKRDANDDGRVKAEVELPAEINPGQPVSTSPLSPAGPGNIGVAPIPGK